MVSPSYNKTINQNNVLLYAIKQTIETFIKKWKIKYLTCLIIEILFYKFALIYIIVNKKIEWKFIKQQEIKNFMIFREQWKYGLGFI